MTEPVGASPNPVAPKKEQKVKITKLLMNLISVSFLINLWELVSQINVDRLKYQARY
jgi:hypothetical protein